MKGSLSLASLSATLFAAFAPSATMAQASVVVSIENGVCRAAVAAQRTAPYSDGGPWASIPSNCARQPQEGERAQLRIRAWKEADATRVVLYAVERDNASPTREREIQIGTYLMRSGERVRVTQTAAITPDLIMLSVQ